SITEKFHAEKGHQQRERDDDGDPEGQRPVTEAQPQDQQQGDETDPEGDVVKDGMAGALDQGGGGVDRIDLDARRQMAVVEAFDFVFDFLDGADRVRSLAQQDDALDDIVLVVAGDLPKTQTVAELDAANVADPDWDVVMGPDDGSLQALGIF